MKIQLNKKLIRHLEFAGYWINLYPKNSTLKAVEFYLLGISDEITKETIWIPKSSIENGRDGDRYYGLDWIFDNPENQDKLERIGYRL